jgi:cytochrome c biogenesis protein CcdA
MSHKDGFRGSRWQTFAADLMQAGGVALVAMPIGIGIWLAVSALTALRRHP